MPATLRTNLTKVSLVLTLAFGLAASSALPAAAAPASTTKNCKVSTPVAQRPVLRLGDRGTCVTVAQGLLKNWKAYNGSYDNNFGSDTQAAVIKVQRQNNITDDGIIGKDTWRVLASTSPATKRATSTSSSSNSSTNDGTRRANAPHSTFATAAKPIKLPSGCTKTTARSVCIDKTGGPHATMYHVVNGKAVEKYPVRIGDGSLDGEVTRTGSFKVTSKDIDHVSSTYDKDMPYSLFFDGGRAIHYSQDFHDNEYSSDGQGASHGCVNLADEDTARRLFDWANVGMPVKIIP